MGERAPAPDLKGILSRMIDRAEHGFYGWAHGVRMAVPTHDEEADVLYVLLAAEAEA